MPGPIRPMLAQLAPGPFDSEQHLFEPKWDGLRAIGYAGAGGSWLQSRNLRRWPHQFPEVVAALEALGQRHAAVVDGELIVPDSRGRPDFEAVMARGRTISPARARRAATERPAVLVVFDLIYLDGDDLRRAGLEERRRRLEAWSADWPRQQAVILSPVVAGEGRRLFEQAVRLGLEGVMAKARGSPYLEGRRSSWWLKVKPFKQEEAWVVGFIPAGARGLRALAVALAADGDGAEAGTPASPPGARLRVAGLVGSGLSAEDQRRLLGLLRAEPAPPQGIILPPGSLPPEWHSIRWVDPRVKVRIQYLERTPHGWLRHASFRGLSAPHAPGSAQAPPPGGETR
ncbi:MAG: hypothetical protein AB1609_01715 [Bacillota bacterium]